MDKVKVSKTLEVINVINVIPIIIVIQVVEVSDKIMAPDCTGNGRVEKWRTVLCGSRCFDV